MDEIVLLTVLLLLHFITDFYLQSSHWVTERNALHAKSIKLLVHSLIHTLLSGLALYAWEYHFGWQNTGQVMLYALLIGASHYVIDLIKSYCPPETRYFIADQVAHLLIIVVVWQQVTDSWHLIQHAFAAMLTKDVLVIAIAYSLVLKPLSVLVHMLLKKWTDELSPEPQASTEENTNVPVSLTTGGEAIGYLERILVLTFVLIGQYGGIGFLLAAKSIFRFGDLSNAQDRKLTEYVMLGTLLSVTLTVLLGVITSQLLGVTTQ